jgi:hypothetical protein
MNKLFNIKSNESLSQNNLLTIKGGTSILIPIITAPVLNLDGGDETDKRAKRPSLSA